MANIDAQMAILEDLSTNGQKSRQTIVDAFNLINTKGTNATTLMGYTSDYFVSKNELNSKMGGYQRKSGLVHDMVKVTDPDGNKTLLTQKYKDNIYKNPFKEQKNVTVIDAGSVSGATNTANASYDVTFATSYAIWCVLGYTDTSDLQSQLSS